MKSPDNLFIDLHELAYLDPSAIVGRTVRIRKPDRVRIGQGSIVDDFTYISCGLTVGDYSHIGASSTLIGGDAHIQIGHFVNCSPGCRLVAASHDFVDGGLHGPPIPADYATPGIVGDIQIDDHVLLGANVIVLPGIHIPEGVAAGACTLFTPKMKLEPWTLYVGIPARPVKSRSSAAIVQAAAQLRARDK